MSTRWQIVARLADKRCACIYVHCDGYPSHAKKMLEEHYTDQQKIDRLIALGDCLSVGETPEKCETFVSRGDLWDEVKPTFGYDMDAVAKEHEHGDEEYRYAWNGQCWAMARV